MKNDEFWTIVDSTFAHSADQVEQLEALYTLLDERTADEIANFQRAFQREQARAYSWDLWGAASIVNGGASDDGFEYFQRWLISRGRQTFETVLAEPDTLADIIEDAQSEPCEFEEFGYVAMDVWTKKTGVDAAADPESTFPYTGAPPDGQPSGRELVDSEAHLSGRYPKLWKRFGVEPLG